ncbi:MAG: hypothetical protein M3P96_01705, partial [Actinomycetota bacterium]|nr:hypothetical protein [Actinomycetota bacterium]
MRTAPAAAPPRSGPGEERCRRAGAERPRVAVAAVFAVNGFAFASWISRTPAVRDRLDLTSSQLGLLLLCLSVGAVAALPASGHVVHRLGPARSVLVGGTGAAAGLLAVAAGVGAGVAPLAGMG